MRRNLFIIGTLTAGILFISSPSAISQPTEGKGMPKGLEASGQKSPSPVIAPIYQPPLWGIPGGRVGGGPRGMGDELATLLVLAPNHVGLTSQEQPVLYWYLSKPVEHPVELTIIIEKDTYPLLEKPIPLPVEPGIQAIRFKELNLHLRKATPYRWFVAIIPDPERRTKDIVAGGMIERIDLPEAVRVKLSQASRLNIPYIYAESGMWYDAIMTLSELIEANPNDMNLRKERAALIEQVGLSKVAQYELEQAGLAK